MSMDWENYGRNRRAVSQQQRQEGYSHSYVEGNTVRKASAAPRRREEIQERPLPKRYPQKKPVRMPGISARAFVFLTVMLTAVILCSFSYLSVQNDVRGMKKEIVSLQTEIAQQKEENDETYQKITASVDLSEIYRRATKKLKMVQAENNQIYTYSNKKSDMVRQYADIPGTGR